MTEQDVDPISPTLLRRARAGDEASWQRLVAACRPRIAGWLSRQRVPPQEAEDLSQDVLATLVQRLPGFGDSARPGGFFAWLRTVTQNRARLYWRQGRYRVSSPGGDGFHHLLDGLPAPAGSAGRVWDADDDRQVLRHLLSGLKGEFEPQTLRAFRRLAFDKASGKEVAAELGLTVTAVYNAKMRILERLRRDVADLGA